MEVPSTNNYKSSPSILAPDKVESYAIHVAQETRNGPSQGEGDAPQVYCYNHVVKIFRRSVHRHYVVGSVGVEKHSQTWSLGRINAHIVALAFSG